ncbi:glycosyltransferase [Algibacter sp. 2305UL17-15]|uniref:glycosyltransferase n=1 Tax=Algibacter sp. 2305UL17-15 TaxID=3231268 RepID=UPI003457B464
MKLSIVIPLYNKEQFIERCLLSLINQDVSLHEYEIIIINDGSTDSSASIVEIYKKKYSNIHLFNQKNLGPSAARNKGIDVAKGEYIYFIDADDYLAENVLNILLKLAEKNNLEILGFNSIYRTDDAKIESSTPVVNDFSLNVMDGITFIGECDYRNEVWWYLIKKDFLIDIGLRFVERKFMVEDSIFTSNIFVKANRVAKKNMDVHRFVRVENSVTTSTDNTHLKKFIFDLVVAIEELNLLMNTLDKSHTSYGKAVKSFKRKQQSYVFTILIKAFKCNSLCFEDLKKILSRLNKLGVYPINKKLGGIGGDKTSRIYNMTAVPIFNNKALLFSSLKFKRLIS